MPVTLHQCISCRVNYRIQPAKASQKLKPVWNLEIVLVNKPPVEYDNN